MSKIKELLDKEVDKRNCTDELCLDKPDPLIVAKKYNDEYISLICALFAYGNAGQIVKFLSSLDFSLLDESEDEITKALSNHYYRFQNSQDVITFFIVIKRLRQIDSLESLFLKGYEKDLNVLEGIDEVIRVIQELYMYSSQGYKFLISDRFKRDKNGYIKEIGNSPYKRWNMFLRWMVREDSIDMGLWKRVDKKDLLLPLDTHTFQVSKKLGLLNRKTYDLKSALLITENLRKFDKNDPIKYDFAIYRLGQEKLV
jgi:uncharacterized protein (TIGR02757 family)